MLHESKRQHILRTLVIKLGHLVPPGIKFLNEGRLVLILVLLGPEFSHSILVDHRHLVLNLIDYLIVYRPQSVVKVSIESVEYCVLGFKRITSVIGFDYRSALVELNIEIVL